VPKEKKRIITQLPLTGAYVKAPLDAMRVGMPASDSILATTQFTPTPGGPTYTIVRTTELDSYKPAPPALKKLMASKGAASSKAVSAVLQAAAPTGDNFAGKARKAAKLSIVQGKTERFADLSAMVKSFAPDQSMIHHKPPITTTATSNRVKEEQRNIRVKAFLYAASRETDNDFHLIIGRDPRLTPELYMTMEVSGLPPKNSPSFSALNTARNSFKTFFGAHLPGTTYDFYRPPVPVELEGPPFFDMTHATGQRPGPQSLKSRMPTIWEVHPVTSIKF
jgi:hypothetical protein